MSGSLDDLSPQKILELLTSDLSIEDRVKFLLLYEEEKNVRFHNRDRFSTTNSNSGSDPIRSDRMGSGALSGRDQCPSDQGLSEDTKTSLKDYLDTIEDGKVWPADLKKVFYIDNLKSSEGQELLRQLKDLGYQKRKTNGKVYYQFPQALPEANPEDSGEKAMPLCKPLPGTVRVSEQGLNRAQALSGTTSSTISGTASDTDEKSQILNYPGVQEDIYKDMDEEQKERLFNLKGGEFVQSHMKVEGGFTFSDLVDKIGIVSEEDKELLREKLKKTGFVMEKRAIGCEIARWPLQECKEYNVPKPDPLTQIQDVASEYLKHTIDENVESIEAAFESL